MKNSNLFSTDENEKQSKYLKTRRCSINFLATGIVSSFPFGANSLESSVQTKRITPSSSTDKSSFRSGAYGLEEYTNAFTASRDTNVSPKEAYDSLQSPFLYGPLQGNSPTKIIRALDVGAGAGVSTQFLWEMGYRDIDAVDWSGDAWQRFVVDDPTGRSPPSVRFWQMDDESFRDGVWRLRLQKFREENRDEQHCYYDAIAFNFAVNDSKARSFAAEMLSPKGVLLAPVNNLDDYWQSQVFRVYDKTGKVLWSAGTVGAWNVQFQPDVTQDTCLGYWCAPFNGFQKKRKK